MIIDFKKQKHSFDLITVKGKEFDIVNHAKILGVTVSNNLWSNHINEVIRKSNKRLYFIILLKILSCFIVPALDQYLSTVHQFSTIRSQST